MHIPSSDGLPKQVMRLRSVCQGVHGMEPHEARGPKDHINMRIPLPGSKAQDKGIPETMVCRSRVFTWSMRPEWPPKKPHWSPIEA